MGASPASRGPFHGEGFLKLLFDHCVPKKLRSAFPSHLVVLAREIGLATLTNGKLLAAAAESGFDALITIDKQMRHQQPISSLPIAVIVIDVHVSKLENLLPLVPEVLACLDKIENGQLRIVTNRS